MNHFEILNCNVNSTLEEIKENYKSLSLKYHPDKNSEHQETFLKINEAWNILKDEKERKLYESQLLSQQQTHMNIYKSVSLSDMEHKGESQMFTYPCRCGAEFCIEEQDTEGDSSDDNILIACDTCSLLLEITAR
ncbi:hypothetical protein M8J75_014212 [Diaphorina citri]|nr:hypothetical protein M8J75_014212 [Diaphorina citri]